MDGLGRIVLPLPEGARVAPQRVDGHERLGERKQRDAVIRRPFDRVDDTVHGALGVQRGGTELGDSGADLSHGLILGRPRQGGGQQVCCR